MLLADHTCHRPGPACAREKLRSGEAAAQTESGPGEPTPGVLVSTRPRGGTADGARVKHGAEIHTSSQGGRWAPPYLGRAPLTMAGPPSPGLSCPALCPLPREGVLASEDPAQTPRGSPTCCIPPGASLSPHRAAVGEAFSANRGLLGDLTVSAEAPLAVPGTRSASLASQPLTRSSGASTPTLPRNSPGLPALLRAHPVRGSRPDRQRPLP